MTRFYLLGQPVELYWSFGTIVMLVVAFLVSVYLLREVFQLNRHALIAVIGINLGWFFIPSMGDWTVYSGMISQVAQMMQVGSLFAAFGVMVFPADPQR